MHVIGTAGHVDHGKSTLVAALTGIDPDRLKEEKAREMTIDLGFAWLKLANGEEVGIVDVPGHRDFIENMLAGVGGIDAVLFVIAADEGVMAQTREHLAIIDLLQIRRGLIVLTKSDLINDSDWFDLVEADIADVVKGTILADAPILRVSARTGEGLDELKQQLAALMENLPPKADKAKPRMPIDRTFSIAGFGTVVTGTLLDGSFSLGDEVVILPSGRTGRIRTIQNHKRKVQQAQPGGRTAINLTGIDVDEIYRGEVLAKPGQYQPAYRLDVHFRLLPDASHPLRHNTWVKLYLGTAEVPARVRIIGSEEIEPGADGWLQLELESEVVAVKGDRYILRIPSPGETIGGGEVLATDARRKHKRFDENVINHFETLLRGSPEELVLAVMDKLGVTTSEEVVRAMRAFEDVLPILTELVTQGDVLALEEGSLTPQHLIVSQNKYTELTHTIRKILADYHKHFPLRLGIRKEELKSRLQLQTKRFNALLGIMDCRGILSEAQGMVRLPEHQIQFSQEQQVLLRKLQAEFDEKKFQPPSVKEVTDMLGEELFGALIFQGELVRLNTEVLFRKREYDHILAATMADLKAGQPVSVASFRDKFQSSRKYGLAFLEHLDASGVTIRDGDFRRLK